MGKIIPSPLKTSAKRQQVSAVPNLTFLVSLRAGQWLFGLLMCDLFVTSDVLMCTSSILHLCTISLERYVAIRYPLWAKNKSKRVVLVKIVLVSLDPEFLKNMEEGMQSACS